MELSITVMVSEIQRAERALANAKSELANAMKRYDDFMKTIRSGNGIPYILESSMKLQFENGHTRLNTQTLNERVTAMFITILRVCYEQDVRLWEAVVACRVADLTEIAEKINGATVVNNYTTNMPC
jgi:hypothetical protein